MAMVLGTPSKAGTKYANPTIQILIGDKETSFHVHYDRLEKTRFFEKHGAIPLPTPNPSPSRQPSAAPSERTVVDEVDVKIEEGATVEVPPLPATTPMPIYKLKGHIYEAPAFEVIVNYLYNERPATPQHRDELRILRKSYILALQYGMEGLQDNIVDCFREFHSHYSIQFEDLLWMARRIEGDELTVCNVPMVQYLISQSAYEISKYDYDKFASENSGFENLLVFGDSLLRKELFRAIVRIPGAPDPALGRNSWRAKDWLPYNPNATNREPSIDIIDVED